MAQTDNDIRLDRYGRPDVEYYLYEARRARAELLGRTTRRLFARLGGLVCRTLFGCRRQTLTSH